ncbi:sialidase family protein [Rhodopirellula sp. JC639]|uniref:sialidase family protein n=1 Tax=Stieleria mannarensis TaxID=2755585 RepID=UPI001C7203DF|nr:sialidase family protein [Rhodopirellula sp. JC639]
MWFRPGAALFTDRNYRLAECPAKLAGEKFLRSSIDSTHFDVVQDGRLIVVTPQSIPRAASQTEALRAQGFSRMEDDPFQLLGNDERDQVLAYEKQVISGESFRFGKWVVVLGFDDARSALNRPRAADGKPFVVSPADIPNTGVLFVDRHAKRKSGHGNNSITECRNGDVVAFYSVTGIGKDHWDGHGVGGWSEYRRSTDGGLTWSQPTVFDYSKRMWERDEICSALVYSLVTAPNGTLIATTIRYANVGWMKQRTPVYFLSDDHGHTWKGPHEFDESATVDDLSYTMNTSFVHDGEVFMVFRGGTSNMTPGGPQTLWVSGDNGKSFSQRSVLPFDHATYYWAAGALDNGEIIVYTYDAHLRSGDKTAEQNIPYVISKDGGRTWSDVQTTHFAKGIRNMQMSGKLGNRYFIQGRSGSNPRVLVGDDPGPNNFVLYSSRDGIHWDEGIVLMSRTQTPGSGDCYSASEVIGKYDPATPERLLIHSDVSYAGGRITNMHQWWVTTAPWTRETGGGATRSELPGQD